MLLTVGLCGGDVCEQQEAAVLRQAADQRQCAHQQLQTGGGEASAVEAEVRRRQQEARSGVKADAAAPDVTLRDATDGSADGRQEVSHLIRADEER